MAGADTYLPFATLIHMMTIKLSSSNYLPWKNQISSLLSCQNLYGFVDGSVSAPATKIRDENNKEVPNPAYSVWFAQDQNLRILIHSSLTEESMAEVLNLQTARDMWVALETAYSHNYKNREMSMRKELVSLKKNSISVTKYGRKFKNGCDQLVAIGCPVNELDKCHWFLTGLGSAFSNFSTTMMAVKPMLGFRDLLAQAS